MTPAIAHLLLASCVCLVILTTCCILLVGDQRRMQQRVRRIDAAIGTYRASRSRGLSSGYRLDIQSQGTGFTNRVYKLLRYNPAHLTAYPVKPLVALLLAVVPAAVLARLAVGFVGPAGWLALPVVCLLLCRALYGRCEDRLTATLFRQFPDALAMIVRAVRVGLPMVEALRVVARENPEPTAREFAGLVAQTSIGVPLDEALREMADRNQLPEYRFFATALSLQSQTGGGLAETLESLADTIRKRLAAKLRGHALAAEARMSSYILGALPLVTGVLLLLTNPSYMSVLFTDPAGHNLLLAAAVLLFIGAFSMRTLIRKSLS
jgi:tight adherence protein B